MLAIMPCFTGVLAYGTHQCAAEIARTVAYTAPMSRNFSNRYSHYRVCNRSVCGDQLLARGIHAITDAVCWLDRKHICHVLSTSLSYCYFDFFLINSRGDNRSVICKIVPLHSRARLARRRREAISSRAIFKRGYLREVILAANFGRLKLQTLDGCTAIFRRLVCRI